MGRIIGIDLGTTNSCVAALEGGQPVVLPSAEGGRTTPSVVGFSDDDDRLVGTIAKRQAVTNPTNTIYSIKRFMGRKIDEVADEQAIVPYQLIANDADAVRVVINGEEYPPEKISALVLDKLKRDAEAYLGGEVSQAVVTVPAYFNDAQRQATKDACEIAGLEVLRLVNEPTAAALAYGLGQTGEQKVLVFDLGGGTFDVSILEMGEGVFEVLATKGDNHLGGDDFDKVVVDWLVDNFKSEKGIDLSQDPAALQRLYEAAEKAKIELSSAPKTQISLPFISASQSGPEHLEMTLDRAQLDDLCAALLDRLVAPTEQALQDANLSADGVDHILLVGGMTRMPAVQDKVRQLTGKDPHRGVNPDEAVALGAAIQAGVLGGEVDDILLLDVTPLSLGIETKGGITTPLILANTTIPARQTETFTTAEDNQPSVEIHIVQGEREMAADNRSLGRLQLLGIPPAQAGVPQIEVTFDIDADGILSVSARDLGTGVSQELRLESSTGLGKEDIEQMRQDAAKHADADRVQRRIAEQRNAVASLRSQARRTLAQYGERISPDERASIEQALDGLDQVLAAPHADLADLEDAQEALASAIGRFSERLYQDSPVSEAEVIDEGG